MRFFNSIGLLNKKTILIGIGIFIIAAANIVHADCLKKQTHPNSLWDVLDYYGLNQPEQKEALQFIMQKAGIIKPTSSFMSTFPKRNNTSLLFKDILSFVELTQKHFTIRSGTQERWEIAPPQWTQENQEEILKALIKLNITNEVTPTFLDPSVICVLGSTMNSMISRLQYIGSVLNKNTLKAKYLVLLVGKRKVTIGVDGAEEALRKIAKKYHISDLSKLTETHLMREAYSNSNIFNKLPTDIIDTPAGNLPRPTTETTVHELCGWLRAHPNVDSIIFISNQPYIKYQEAIINEVFKRENIIIKFEVVGPEVGLNKAKTQNLLEALGSQIWAQTPSVIARTKISTDDQSLKDAFIKLYAKQPLIYKNVESLLSQ